VAALAAGEPFDGFETGSLDWVEECPWVAVPPRLAGRNRFVVRIAGDSMSPGLKIGDHVVFEYHRSPRTDREVVIANLTVFDADSSARTAGAVKRLTQDPETWIFRSDNPAYQDIRVSKAECQYPILGVLVGVLRRTSAESQA
jgi:SOS-response transcriptional repressor LexA